VYWYQSQSTDIELKDFKLVGGPLLVSVQSLKVANATKIRKHAYDVENKIYGIQRKSCQRGNLHQKKYLLFLSILRQK
jgi:hypothetical protein